MDKMVGEIAVAVIVGFFSSWISTRFALRQFRSESWWERQADAYTKIMDSLLNMFRKYDTEQEERAGLTEIAPEQRTKMAEIYAESLETLKRHRMLDGFLISSAAEQVLISLERSLEAAKATDSFPDYLDNSWDALNKALTDMKRAARDDLRTPKRLRWVCQI